MKSALYTNLLRIIAIGHVLGIDIYAELSPTQGHGLFGPNVQLPESGNADGILRAINRLVNAAAIEVVANNRGARHASGVAETTAHLVALAQVVAGQEGEHVGLVLVEETPAERNRGGLAARCANRCR